MSQHTPGPWTWNGTALREPGGAEVMATLIGATLSEANARLIAAAPDLLEVLRTLVRITSPFKAAWEFIDNTEDGEELYDQARAAIAKATGDTQEEG